MKERKHNSKNRAGYLPIPEAEVHLNDQYHDYEFSLHSFFIILGERKSVQQFGRNKIDP